MRSYLTVDFESFVPFALPQSLSLVCSVTDLMGSISMRMIICRLKQLMCVWVCVCAL